MGKYAKYQNPRGPAIEPVHPVWRGIGCLLMLLAPVISLSGALVIVDYGLANNWPIPYELLGRVQFPDWVWKVNVLRDIAQMINNIEHLYAIIAFFILLLALVSGIVSVIYSLFFKTFAPPRYSPMDAPPSRRKTKRYKR